MIKIEIPSFGIILLKHVVLDYNGTIALDGFPEKHVINQLEELNKILQVHILTADTFGKVDQELGKYTFNIHILTPRNENDQKLEFVKNLNPKTVIAFGNGSNDTKMLEVAALGIGIIGREGMSGKVLHSADILISSINEGIDLLFNPLRIKATLRS